MRKNIQDGQLQENVDALKVFQSLLTLPTLFEGQIEEEDLVRQAVRQNVHASYISPVSCVQWVHMVLVTHFGVAASWPKVVFLFCA